MSSVTALVNFKHTPYSAFTVDCSLSLIDPWPTLSGDDIHKHLKDTTSPRHFPPAIPGKVESAVAVELSLSNWCEHRLEFLAIRQQSSPFCPYPSAKSVPSESVGVLKMSRSKLKVFISSRSPKYSGHDQFQLVLPPRGYHFCWTWVVRVGDSILPLGIIVSVCGCLSICGPWRPKSK